MVYYSHTRETRWLAVYPVAFKGGKHMAKKRGTDQKDRKLQGEKIVSRRDFVKKGAAAGVSAAVLSTSGTALAQVSPAQAIQLFAA